MNVYKVTKQQSNTKYCYIVADNRNDACDKAEFITKSWHSNCDDKDKIIETIRIENPRETLSNKIVIAVSKKGFETPMFGYQLTDDKE